MKNLFVRVCSIVLVGVGLLVSGCVTNAKPLTPIETQVLAQVVAHRLILPKLSGGNKAKVLVGLAAAKVALKTATPQEILANLSTYLGPENADIAALITVFASERIDFTQIPEVEGKSYLNAILSGIEGGLQ